MVCGAIEHVLADLRSERLVSVQKLGKADSEYRKITFHKETLEQDQHLDAVLVGPGHSLYAAVDEKLNAALDHAAGATALFIDAQAAAPYRLYFFEISVKVKDSRGADVPLYAEVVAVREEVGSAGGIEVVPCRCADRPCPPPAALVEDRPGRPPACR